LNNARGEVNRGLFAWAKDFGRLGTKVVDESWTPWGDHVSTVWLGLDHSFGGDGPPLIFETMIFDRRGESISCDRYATEVEALAGHRRQHFKALLPPPCIRLVRWLQSRFGSSRN